MSKFQEFLESQKGAPRQGSPVDGCFGCQTCDLEVDEAEYFHIEHVLKWTCPEGHTSYIEDFRI